MSGRVAEMEGRRARFFGVLGLYTAWLVFLSVLAYASGIAPRTLEARPTSAAPEATVPR